MTETEETETVKILNHIGHRAVRIDGKLAWEIPIEFIGKNHYIHMLSIVLRDDGFVSIFTKGGMRGFEFLEHIAELPEIAAKLAEPMK